MRANKFINRSIFTTAILSLFLLSAPLLSSADSPSETQGHRTLKATVTKVSPDMISFTTEENTTRNFSTKVLENFENVKNPKVGDRLVLGLDEGNSIIYIDRLENYQATGNRVNPIVSGELVKFDSAERKATLKLKDGSTNTYRLIPPAGIKMATVPEGSMVSIEIDEQNGLVKDVHRKG
ncbi:MAG: hypothetical protein HY282_18200 [Nitrospirae bacterium]|nr:hypothetical protein [Candidatus Manganitrophaceae bacterium]